jgi:transposase-like protein
MDKLRGRRSCLRGDILIARSSSCARIGLRYKLSLRDLVEMMAERGLDIAHTTIMRWVQRYVPESRSAGMAMHARAVSRGVLTRRI